MTTVNQGRNEIRFGNSDGKCLLENWVEERAVKDIGLPEPLEKPENPDQLLKAGHKGLLTCDFDSKAENLTTVRDSYRPPQHPQVREKGSKREALEKMLYEQISQEVHEEFNPPPDPIDYKSVTHNDFNKDDFVSEKPKPTAHHDYTSEQPVTFWTEHKERITGTSQLKTLDSPFRKNASFSKPIEEYSDQAQPYNHENVPKM